jgi:hypothetical protein
MVGRDFLVVAREAVRGTTSAHWRDAAGRAYYALFLECREVLRGWGIAPAPRDNAHSFVRLRLTYCSDPDLHNIGLTLDRLIRLRNRADYELHAREFDTDSEARDAITRATDAIALLDAVTADAARSAAAVADIRTRWP